DLAHHAISGHTQRIINVENDGLAFGQTVHIRHTTTRVDLCVVELSQFKDLCIDFKPMTSTYMPDTTLLLLAKAITGKLFSRWSSYPFTSSKVKEILPVPGHYPLPQFAAFVRKVRVFTAKRKRSQVRLAIE